LENWPKSCRIGKIWRLAGAWQIRVKEERHPREMFGFSAFLAKGPLNKSRPVVRLVLMG
jgi:hypothetical protein